MIINKGTILKGRRIDGDEISFELLDNSNDDLYLWSAKAEVIYQEERKSCFLKLVKKGNGYNYLLREAETKVYFPYTEQICGAAECRDKDNQQWYCVYGEYIKGDNLKDYMTKYAESQRTDEDEKVMFRQMIQLLKGVQYYMKCISKDPFVHRDLKPENLMITEDRLVIVDFDQMHVPYSGKTMREAEYRRFTKGYADPTDCKTKIEKNVKVDFYAIGRIFCFFLLKNHYFSDEEYDCYYKVGFENLAYGLDEARFNSKYRGMDSKYYQLMNIIKKLVAVPEERYSDINDIIKDMKRFIKDFYKNDKKSIEFILEEEMILTELLEEYRDRINLVIEYNGTADSKALEKYGVISYEIDKKPVLYLYNVNGKLKHIICDEALQREDRDSEEDIIRFIYGEKEVVIEIY